MNSEFETLGRDKTRLAVSSQSVIKSGPNRGSRLPEKGGTWTYMSGYDYHNSQSERSVHHMWAKNLSKMGFRIGTHDVDGVKNFYVFQPKSPKAR